MNIKNKLLLIFTFFAILTTKQCFAVIKTAEVLEKDDKIVFLFGDWHGSSYLTAYHNEFKRFLNDPLKKLELLIVDYIILELEQVMSLVEIIKKINKNSLDIILEQAYRPDLAPINWEAADHLVKNAALYILCKQFLQEYIFSTTNVPVVLPMLFFEILANNFGIPTTNIDFRPRLYETFAIKHYLLTDELNKILDEIKNYKDKNKKLAEYYKKTFEDYIELLFTKPYSLENIHAYNRLLDARTIHQVMNSDKKIFVVIEGAFHTNNISAILKTIGFKEKEKLDYTKIPDDFWNKNHEELIKEKIKFDYEDKPKKDVFTHIILQQDVDTPIPSQLQTAEERIFWDQILLPILQKNIVKDLHDFMQRHLEPYIKIKSKL